MKLETIEEINKLTRRYTECIEVLDLINNGRDLSLSVDNGINECGTSIKLFGSMESEITEIVKNHYERWMKIIEERLRELINTDEDSKTTLER